MDAQREAEIAARLREVEVQNGKLWTAHRELATVVWGDDRTRDNGLRSRVGDIEGRVGDLEEDDVEMKAKLSHYLDVERLDTCHGLRGLAEHEQSHEKSDAEETKSKTQIAVARIQAWSQAWAPIFTFLGIAYLALMERLK